MKVLFAFLVGIGAGVLVMLFRPAPVSAEACPQPAIALAATPVSAPAQPTPPAEPAPKPAEPMPAMAPAAAPATVAPAAEPAVDAPAPPTTAAIDLAGIPASAVNGLRIPVAGVAAGDLSDTFTQARSEGRVHDAIDIMAARGTPVVAANDGEVVKLFNSVRGGLTVYQFGPAQKVVYYYAHLDSYAPGLAEGQQLHRGDPIGLVGSTGNASAEAPHLHFEIGVLGPEKHWWQSRPINPYGRLGEP